MRSRRTLRRIAPTSTTISARAIGLMDSDSSISGAAALSPRRGWRGPGHRRPAGRRGRPGSRRPRAATSRPRQRRTGASPAASNAPISPPSTSPAPAVASHGVPVVVTRTRPSGSAISVWRPLSSTVAAYSSAAERAWWSWRASTSVAVDAEHPGELAGVGREHGGTAEGALRDGSGRRRRPRAGRRRRGPPRAWPAAPSPLPLPTTQACTRPAPTTSGWACRTRSATASSPT